MAALNYKHLRYFWMVAKTGSIAKAAAQLHLTPHAISGQLSEFAEALGVELFRRSGRNLELTDTGRRIHVSLCRCGDEISTGQGELWQLEVSDDGCGFAETDLRRITSLCGLFLFVSNFNFSF